jgi:hypothetical protein
MTGREAARILERPIFGDEQCLRALRILEVMAELKGALLPPDDVVPAGPLEDFSEEDLYIARETAVWRGQLLKPGASR